MSGIDEKRYLKKTYEMENNPSESHSTKSDYYGLNIATFTFGGKQPHPTNNQHKVMNRNIDDEPAIRNNFRKTNSSKKLEIDRGKEKNLEFAGGIIPVDKKILKNDKEISNLKENYKESSHTSIINQNNITFTNNVVILNKIGAHNSFLSVVVHSLSNMSSFRNYILNEVHLNYEKDFKNKLLHELKNVMVKYMQPIEKSNSNSIPRSDIKKIDITKLRMTLAEVFQNRRKFLIDQPDDPIDCLFAFINCVHSYSMVIIFMKILYKIFRKIL